MEDIWAAITVMAGNTPDRIPEARRDYFDLFEQLFNECDAEPPEWIDELRQRVAQG